MVEGGLFLVHAPPFDVLDFHLSPRLCPSTEGCSPPSMPSIVVYRQDCPTGNCIKRETKRQTEEMIGRQHQRMDWLSMEHHTAES